MFFSLAKVFSWFWNQCRQGGTTEPPISLHATHRRFSFLRALLEGLTSPSSFKCPDLDRGSCEVKPASRTSPWEACPLCFLTAYHYHSNEAKRASSRDQGYPEHSLSILSTPPTGCGTSVLEVMSSVLMCLEPFACVKLWWCSVVLFRPCGLPQQTEYSWRSLNFFPAST